MQSTYYPLWRLQHCMPGPNLSYCLLGKDFKTTKPNPHLLNHRLPACFVLSTTTNSLHLKGSTLNCKSDSLTNPATLYRKLDLDRPKLRHNNDTDDTTTCFHPRENVSNKPRRKKRFNSCTISWSNLQVRTDTDTAIH